MSDERVDYEWVRSLSGPPWTVKDWRGHLYKFATETDQLAFIDRDRRMFAAASREANGDVITQITNQFQVEDEGIESGDGEQAVDASGEAEATREGVGGQGNRESRRRASRAANRKKAAS